jgi:uncharacterized tellurite resistance protein B-like protein
MIETGDIMKKKIDQIASAEAKTLIVQIIEQIAQPNGFSKLRPDQRKFLLAAILGTIVPADGKVREVELAQFEDQLKRKYGLTAAGLQRGLAVAQFGLRDEHLKQVSGYLPDLLSIEDRTSLIGMLWDLALCDHELHSSEEKMILQIADKVGVTRKRVIEEQAKAAGHYRS